MSFKNSKPVVVLLLISLFLALTGTISIRADEKEESLSKYYGPRDGIEIKELRTETAKQYLLPDGTMQYIASPDRIHWKDSTGHYQDINNTIVETIYDTEDTHYTYTNQSNDLRVYFTESSSQGPFPVRIEFQDRSVSYRIDDAQFQKIPTEEYQFPELFEGNIDSKSTVIFETAEDWDAVYTVKSSGVKEYLILSERCSKFEFSFIYRTEGLTPEQREDGIVFVNEEGENIFVINGLYAIDSGMQCTDSINATLVSVDGNEAVIKVAVSSEWLEEENRVYPVIIDPMTMVCGEYCTYDSYISSVDANVNFYVNDYLRMGKDDDFGVRRTAIKFDLPNVASSTVTSAYINVRLYSYEGSLTTLYGTPITSSWSSSGITWNNQPSYNTSYKYSHAVSDTWHDTSNWYAWPVTSLTKQWLAGTTSNYGVILFDSVENNTSHWTTFYSSDYGSPNRPELMVNYNSRRMNYYALCTFGIADTNNSMSTRGYFTTLGYSPVSQFNCQYNSDVYDGLPDDRVSIIHGHGGAGFIAIENDGYIYATGNTNSFSNYDDNILSGNKLIVVITCKSGANGNNSVVNVLNTKGAQCTIGFINNVAYGGEYMKIFAKYLANGNQINQALTLADAEFVATYNYSGNSSPANATNRKVCGNTGMTMYP